MSQTSSQLQSVLESGAIRTRRVLVLGAYAHIDTFEKYEDRLSHVMSGAGFEKLSAANGRHMDGVDGFRVVFRMRRAA